MQPSEDKIIQKNANNQNTYYHMKMNFLVFPVDISQSKKT